MIEVDPKTQERPDGVVVVEHSVTISGRRVAVYRRLRRTYKELSLRMICALGEHFPAGTRVTRPQGGHILWVELPPQVDALDLYEAALENRICVAPGPMFSLSDHYNHHIRLNSGLPWTAELEAAISRLGELASMLADS